MVHKNKIYYALSIAWQLGFLITIPIIIFLFLGYWIDQQLNSGHLFMILFLIISFIINYYEIYHLLRPLIKKENEPKY